MLSLVVGPRACCSSNLSCAIVISLIVMVAGCRSWHSCACRGTHDTTVAMKVGSCLNQYCWKPFLQIYHGRHCRREAGNLQPRPGVGHGVFGAHGIIF